MYTPLTSIKQMSFGVSNHVLKTKLFEINEMCLFIQGQILNQI